MVFLFNGGIVPLLHFFRKKLTCQCNYNKMTSKDEYIGKILEITEFTSGKGYNDTIIPGPL